MKENLFEVSFLENNVNIVPNSVDVLNQSSIFIYLFTLNWCKNGVVCTGRQKLGIASHQCSLHSLTGVKIDDDRILRALSKNGTTPSFVIKVPQPPSAVVTEGHSDEEDDTDTASAQVVINKL